MAELTQEEVRRLFSYDAKGYLIRAIATMGPSGKKGDIIGCYGSKDLGKRSRRYVTTKISGRHYTVHRLIFLWHHGYLPEQIDHINGNSTDNRIENLRPADAALNSMNRKTFANNKSGARGVIWHKRVKQWFAYVDCGGKRVFSRYFKDFELASLVAEEAREKFHGGYASNFIGA